MLYKSFLLTFLATNSIGLSMAGTLTDFFLSKALVGGNPTCAVQSSPLASVSTDDKEIFIIAALRPIDPWPDFNVTFSGPNGLSGSLWELGPPPNFPQIPSVPSPSCLVVNIPFASSNNRTRVVVGSWTLRGYVNGILEQTLTFEIKQGDVLLEAGSVANGASYQSGIVPGSWAQVKGTGLAPTTRIWKDSDFTGGNNLPTSLDGVEVKVNGLPAAVYFISPTQISFQVPAGVSGTVTVQVIRNGVASATIAGQAVDSAPGLFGYAAGAKTYPAAVYANTTIVVGDPAVSGSAVRKALPGDRVALYATGIASSPAGVIVGVSGLSGVTATIGTTPATVEFAGLVAVGQFQINILVPNLPPGEYPVVIHYNGKDSLASILFPVGP